MSGCGGVIFCIGDKLWKIRISVLTIVRKSVIILLLGGDVIFMCDQCGKYICPPSCPKYVGRSAYKGRIYGICGVCRRIIYVTDRSIRKGEVLLCEECAFPSEDNNVSIRNFFKF